MRAALSVHAERGSDRRPRRLRLRHAVDQVGGPGARQMGRQAARPWSSSTPRRPAPLKSFRNIPRVQVAEVGAIGVADVIGAASLVVSESALEKLRGAARLMDARTVIIRPVVSEKSYALIAEGKYTFRVDDRAHKTQIARAVEEIFGVERRRGAHLEGALEAEAPRPLPGAHPRLEEGDRPARAGRADRAVRRRRDRVGSQAMPNRKTKPTSPGRRFATYPLREPLTATEPERKLTEGLRKSGGRNVNGRVTARHRGGGAKRRYRKIDFKRLKDGVPGEGRDDRVRPEPQLLHRPAPLRRRREALHPRPGGICGRRPGPVRPRRRHHPGQRPGAARDADRHDRPQRRAGPRPGRQARPRRRHRDPAGGEGGRHGHPAAAVHRRCGWSAPSAGRRSARSPTPSTRT